ncbi:hypothetical protein ROZALSC1DRAFT_31640 [Rozella allomycis CSF55]|uniref:Uncharacterized protein n=1 Tax=Rozella allomycis (strain CSF55) TaxID=988480 RepID=A0A075AMG3_ROZAC|nr:hypothetical protein O9G_006270 [Rozella allomycis CSF55]RKP16422.1 hypothetical protein ROZALSC1DRAFT_31640 [Rozella allomycis CSF55]|eukprot:EPZ30778.1 hypothetical protein O9G_006270 [Rozella allomycis CSF55]
MSPPGLIPTHKDIEDKFARIKGLTFYKRDEALRFECLLEMDGDLKPQSQEFLELDKKIKENEETQSGVHDLQWNEYKTKQTFSMKDKSTRRELTKWVKLTQTLANRGAHILCDMQIHGHHIAGALVRNILNTNNVSLSRLIESAECIKNLESTAPALSQV